MFALGLRRSFLQLRGLTNQSFSRTFLSSEYFCQQEWDKRLQEPVFSGVNADEFFFQMKERIKMKLPIEPIDVDIFANVTSNQNLEECVYFLTLLRENKRTAFTLDSTHHAVCRAFLKADSADKLVPILHNPLKYGVFPDNFSFNMILDHFLEKSDFSNATKVANLYMLQEDYSPLTNILALNAVYGCLMDPVQKESLCAVDKNSESQEDTEKSNEDDDEVQYVRVPYVRNAPFDDHFDIKDPLILSGKTLYMIGMRYNGIIGRTSQLIGLAFWKKWNLAEDLIKKLASSNSSNGQIATGALELITSSIEPVIETDEEAKSFLEKLKSNEKLVSGEHIHSLVKKELNLIPELEAKDCTDMKSVFSQWSIDRANAIKEQMEKYMREEKIKEIKSLKQELELKERKLNFFENFNKIEMEYTEAQKKLDELKASQAEEEYFPPTINRR